MDIKTKSHWEEIYKKKMPNEVSWTQETPQTSIDFLVSFNLFFDKVNIKSITFMI